MSTAATVTVQTNPFPGLRPFREDEEYLFFGRESQVDAMVNTLAATHFLAVVGTSGSGKSSLVNCGLRPALHRGLMTQAGTVWRMAQFRPGNDPLRVLARALAGDGVLFRGYEAAGGLTLAEIIDTTLRMSKLGLIDIYEQARLGDGVNLLLVVDQFEELFRYRQLGASQKENAYGVSAEATAFMNLLLEVRERTTYPIYVVLTMRSDFLGDCAQFPGLSEAINTGQYLVPRLTRDERRAAISGPVGVGGAEIAPVLLTRLVNDVGDNPDQLSILQHALNRTWACWQREGSKGPLDLMYYNAIGTMAHALDQHAERAYYAELDPGRQQQICEKLFKALTDKVTDPRGVRRPTKMSTLCALADATAAEVTEVIDVFRKPSRSFLMPPAGDALQAETVIDISHESLMRVWERLKGWADEEAQSAATYKRLAERAELYELRKEDLLRDPGLQLALDWRNKEKPTLAWAERYHAGFEQTLGFLQASVACRDEEVREQEAQRQEQETQRQRALEQAQALAEEQQRRAEEQARAARRLRWLSAGLLVILLFAVGATVFAWSQSHRAEQQTRLATARELAAQALSRYARLDLALLSSLEANHFTDKVETRRNLLDRLQRSSHLTAFLTGHTSFVLNVAFSPDGKTLASGSRDNTIILWDVASHQRLGDPLIGHVKPVRSVAFSPDGKTLASGSDDTTIILWNVTTPQRPGVPLTGHTKPVRSVAFSPDGKTLASGSDDTTIILWNVTTLQRLGDPLTGHITPVRSVAFSPDGKILAAGSDDTTIILWDVASRQLLGTLKGCTTPVRSVAFSPDGKILAAGSDDTTIILWDVASHQRLGDPLTGHANSVPSVAFSPDGKTLASGSRDTTIILWDVASHQRLGDPLTGHANSVPSVAFSPDGKTLASGSLDTTIILWDVTTPQRLGTPLIGHTNSVLSVAFSPDSKTLASGSDDKTIILWDVTAPQPLGTPLTGHTNFVWSVAFSPDGKTLASGSKDTTITLWDVTPQPLDTSFTGHTSFVLSMAFSPDGKTLASGSKDTTIILWDVTTRQPLGQPLTGHTDSVLSMAFSPDSKTLASGSKDTTIILWDVATHQRLGNPLKGHTRPVRSVAFSPDGKTLASGSDENTIILWDVTTHQRPHDPLTGHARSVRSVAFSPDGKTLASGSDDTTIILWDVATRQPLGNPLTGHIGFVSSVAFSPDSKTLASGSDDTTIILWDVSLASWQKRACRIANRNFTRAEWKLYIGGIEPYRATCPGLPIEPETKSEKQAGKQG